MNILKTTVLAAAIAFSMAACAHSGAGNATDRTAGQVIDDASITAAVKAKLLADDRTDGLDTNVDTRKGMVTLSGGADTQRAKDYAGKLAAEVDGVVMVHNELIVATEGTERREDANTATASGEVREAMDESGDSIDDAWITSKVKTQLLADTDVRGMEIDVDTKANIVTLSGKAQSVNARAKAIEIARGTKGVRSVIADQLVISN